MRGRVAPLIALAVVGLVAVVALVVTVLPKSGGNDDFGAAPPGANPTVQPSSPVNPAPGATSRPSRPAPRTSSPGSVVTVPPSALAPPRRDCSALHGQAVSNNDASALKAGANSLWVDLTAGNGFGFLRSAPARTNTLEVWIKANCVEVWVLISPDNTTRLSRVLLYDAARDDYTLSCSGAPGFDLRTLLIAFEGVIAVRNRLTAQDTVVTVAVDGQPRRLSCRLGQ